MNLRTDALEVEAVDGTTTAQLREAGRASATTKNNYCSNLQDRKMTEVVKACQVFTSFIPTTPSLWDAGNNRTERAREQRSTPDVSRRQPAGDLLSGPGHLLLSFSC